MRILITGASGRIGSELASTLAGAGHYVFGTFLDSPAPGSIESQRADMSNTKDCASVFKKASPDAVIHSAALVDADLCEIDRTLADRANITGTDNVIAQCRLIGCSFAFISSSFVFDGKKEVFSEDDTPNPVNYYGVTKMVGESHTVSSGVRYLILRTDQTYGPIRRWQRDNSVTRALRSLRAHTVYEDFTDWYNNPTFTPDLAMAAATLVTSRRSGIYHLVGPDYISRYDWSLKIADAFGLDRGLVKPCLSSSVANLKARRPNANLSNSKVCAEDGINFRGVDDALKLMAAERMA